MTYSLRCFTTIRGNKRPCRLSSVKKIEDGQKLIARYRSVRLISERGLGGLEMRFLAGVAMMVVAFALGGCSSMPASGPTVAEVESGQGGGVSKGFIVADIDDSVVATTSLGNEVAFARAFTGAARRPDLRIGIGDVLQIAVIESGSGLFGQSAGTPTLGAQSVAAVSNLMQPVTVPQDGFINVPFAGRIRALGRTPDQLRAEIEGRLANKAISPQAEVAIVSSSMNSATVSGEVNHAGVFPLALGGSKLLDLVAAAGGARFPAYDVKVHLNRGGHLVVASLENIVDHPSENIYLRPHDSIYLSHDPPAFTAFGATNKVGRYEFQTERVTLAEAVAEAGGAADATADPSGVFLFRYEAPRVVEQFRPDLSGTLSAHVPVVYRLNLRAANGYFLAQRFQMRDKDVILLATAEGSNLLKFLVLLHTASEVVYDLRTTSATLGN
jgi:polysaccharide export outer membrane protein